MQHTLSKREVEEAAPTAPTEGEPPSENSNGGKEVAAKVNTSSVSLEIRGGATRPPAGGDTRWRWSTAGPDVRVKEGTSLPLQLSEGLLAGVGATCVARAGQGD